MTDREMATREMTTRERIRYLRHELRLTQEKFSKQISLSTSYLAGLETGERKINERVIRLISNAFNVSEHWINTGEGQIFNEGLDASLSKVTNLFKSLSPKSKECALEQLNALYELERTLKS